jgi:hypothetical protein
MFEEDDDAQDPVYDLLLAVALLDLVLYSVKNEEFWNSEVGRAAVEHHLENMLVKQEDQREKEEEEEEDIGEAGVQQHCENVKKDQEDLERRELKNQM